MVRRVAAAAALAGGVAAQITPNAYIEFVSSSMPPMSSESVSYTTITYDDCPTGIPETMVTVTDGTTVTFCPACEHEQTGYTIFPTPAPTSKKPGHTTIYTTEYMSLCPTGTVPVTYTVTESCEEETPTWTHGEGHIPPGFTTTVKDCDVCEGGTKETPVPVTITEPCDCEATSGAPLPPSPPPASAPPPAPAPPAPTGTPVTQIPDGQIQAPGPSPAAPGPSGTPVSQIPDGQIQAPGPSAPGPVRPPYPTTEPAAQCPGPDCMAGTAPAGTAPGMPPASTSPGTPESPEIPGYDGAASSLRICGALSVVAVVVGAFAVLL